jgi:hypothetical protein
MKLPNREKAYIPPLKLKAYLLSETHPIGKAKAKLLRSAGFNETSADLLKEVLLTIARSEDIKDVIESPHGVKYIIEGQIQTPAGGNIGVRTVWIIDKGRERPRFVTAYPI